MSYPRACRLMREAGYEIGNIDCTIIAQRPKISPHKPLIKVRFCLMLCLTVCS